MFLEHIGILPTGNSVGGLTRDLERVSEELYLRVLFGKFVGIIPVKMWNILALKAWRKFPKQIFPGMEDEIETYLLMAVLFSKYISFNHIVAFNQLYFNITICQFVYYHDGKWVFYDYYIYIHTYIYVYIYILYIYNIYIYIHISSNKWWGCFVNCSETGGKY